MSEFTTLNLASSKSEAEKLKREQEQLSNLTFQNAIFNSRSFISITTDVYRSTFCRNYRHYHVGSTELSST